MDRVSLFLPVPTALLLPCAPFSWPKTSLPILLAIAAFVIDINTPNGVLDGLLYVSAVLVCVWVPTANSPLYTALGLMLLMILGFAMSPSGIFVEVAVANRCVAIGLIWLAAFAVWRCVRSMRERDSILSALSKQLRAAELAACMERTALSEWIRTEISPELQILEWRLRCLPHRACRDFDLPSEALILHRAIRRASQCAQDKEARLRYDGPGALII